MTKVEIYGPKNIKVSDSEEITLYKQLEVGQTRREKKNKSHFAMISKIYKQEDVIQVAYRLFEKRDDGNIYFNGEQHLPYSEFVDAFEAKCYILG